MSVSPHEQLFVYMLNRARHDPVAYQQEASLPVDLSYVSPQPPLAVNNDLFDSAEFHATEMAVHNYFAHQSAVTNQWPNQMARNEGYVLPGFFPNDANNIESLAAGTFYNNAGEPLEALIVDEGVNPPGHRNHLLGIGSFSAGDREIGVGHAFNANAQFDNYWAIHATRTDTNDKFLAGVVFNDANANGRYDLNEGLANVTVSAGGGLQTVTTAAGGWSIEVGAGSYTVTAAGPGFAGTATAMASVNSNVEVDFISGQSQGIVNFTVPTANVSISDATANEGTGIAVFNITLSAASSQAVAVGYSTSGGSATAGSDFLSQSGVVTFSPGMVTRTVTIAVSNDLLDEATESFSVNLSGAINGTVVDGQGIGTIVDNDNADPQPNNILVVAPGAGRVPLVRVLNRTTLAEKFSFLAYDPAFQGGVSVATGDVTGDGVLDIVVSPGIGGGPHVRVFDGATGNNIAGPVGNFFAYAANFLGGVSLAVGDINGDNRADIVTAPESSGGPHVRIFSGLTGGVLGEYMAYAPSFTGGVHVAVGDVDGNTIRDVITAPARNGGPHVRVFSGATAANIAGPLGNFFAYAPTFSGGVWVAAGDLNGDGRADVVTAPNAGGGPHVRAFSGLNGSELVGFMAYFPGFTGGVRVAAGDFSGDGRADIITAPGPGGGPHVRVLHGQTLADLRGLMAYEPSFAGGVFVAGSPAGVGGAPLSLAASVSTGNDNPAALSQDQLELIRAAAITRWQEAGLSGTALECLQGVELRLTDLAGRYLGLTYDDAILIDLNGAGAGWYVDATPLGDIEFSRDMANDLLFGQRSSSADLLTVVAHELGHLLGLDDLDPLDHGHALMSGELASATRRLPTAAEVDAVFAVGN